MRRPTRHLFAASAGLSLLMCAASAALWVRSYSGTDYVSRGRLVSSDPLAVVSRSHQLAWTRGDVRLSAGEHTYYPHGSDAPPDPSAGGDAPARWGYGRLGRGHIGWEREPGRSLWARLGFERYDTGWGASFADEREAVVAFPAWLPVALFAVLPLAFAARAARGRQRRWAGRCARCGYDLRASPQRCPECGAATGAP